MIWRGDCLGHIHRIQNPVDQHVLMRVPRNQFTVVPRVVLVFPPGGTVDVHVLTGEVNLLVGVHGRDFHWRVSKVVLTRQVEVVFPGLWLSEYFPSQRGQSAVDDLASRLILHHHRGGKPSHRLVIDLIKSTHRLVSRWIRGKHE
ncbi:hypothetical protein D3C73_1195510 [compost metagenome]